MLYSHHLDESDDLGFILQHDLGSSIFSPSFMYWTRCDEMFVSNMRRQMQKIQVFYLTWFGVIHKLFDILTRQEIMSQTDCLCIWNFSHMAQPNGLIYNIIYFDRNPTSKQKNSRPNTLAHEVNTRLLSHWCHHAEQIFRLLLKISVVAPDYDIYPNLWRPRGLFSIQNEALN
jgi:hypothetical protein